MRARAPIVPIAVVGAEEAAPVFAQVKPLQRLTGLLYFPITPTFPHFGLLGMLGYLPAKFKLRFLPRGADRRSRLRRRAVGGQGARADRRPRDPRHHPGRARSTCSASGAASGSDELPSGSSLTGPVDVLGRPARAGARARPGGRGDHRRRPPPAEGRAAPHRVRARRPTRTRSSAASSRRPRSTRWSTRGWWSTRSSPARAWPTRTTSSGTMNVLAACGGEGNPVRKVVFKSSAHYYGAEQDDPAFFTEAMDRPHAPRTPIERDIVDAERAVREFALRHPHVTVTVLRFANGLGPALRTSLSQLFGLPAVPGDPGLRPALSVHPRGRPRRLPGARRAPRPRGRLQRRRRRRARAQRGRRAAGQAARARAAARGRRRWRRAPCAAPACASRRRRSACCATAAALDNRKLKATGYRYRYTSREAVHQAARAPAPGRHPRRRPGGLPLRARPRGVPAPQPERAADRPPARARPVEPGSRRAPRRRPRPGAAGGYDDLDADELIALLPSLEPEALAELAEHERAHAARPEVLKAIASLQGWEART